MAESAMVFFRVGWMDRYQGLIAGDEIKHGGDFVRRNQFGHEVFNFRPYKGQVLGFVQPPGRAPLEADRKINIGRLGARSDEVSVSGVFVIWVAKCDGDGQVIVGWYRNATVHRFWQKAPMDADRVHEGIEIGYFASASVGDVTLLPVDERVFEIPSRKGGIGQANIWYADAEDMPEQVGLRQRVLEYVQHRRIEVPISQASIPRQVDPLLRQMIEKAAIEKVTSYYAGLGYQVQSVEKDNAGWDLEAKHAIQKDKLRLEVKGLSGSDLCFELTPNEYAKMKENRSTYRLCIVTQALNNPELSVFTYSGESEKWTDANNRILHIDEAISARCSIS